MKKLLVLLLLPLATAANAFDFGNMLRSVSNSLGGGSEKASATGTATLGIRGYLGDSLKTTAPDPNGVKTLGTWKATPQDAKANAKKTQLQARDVTLGGAPASSPAAPEGEAP